MERLSWLSRRPPLDMVSAPRVPTVCAEET